MKKAWIPLLLAVLLLAGCSNPVAPEMTAMPASPAPETTPAAVDVPVEDTLPGPSIHWRVDTTGKYLQDDAVRQLITVQHTGGSACRVSLFEKSSVKGVSVWTKTLVCEGILGKEGLGKTKEGDNKTPIGDFGITTAFGLKPNPGTALPYLDVDENLYCCGEGEWYNQMIDITEHPHDCTGEHLIDYTPEYNYGLFLDYNREGMPGLGSAIFFHCAGANTYTGGCIAVEEEDMVTILRALTEGARVIIDYMP